MRINRLLPPVALAAILAAGSGALAWAQQSGGQPSDTQPAQTSAQQADTPYGAADGQSADGQSDWLRSDWDHADAMAARTAKALNMLESDGDGQFSNFAVAGGNFTADVTKDGRTMPVVIDPDTQQITPTSGAG